MGAPGGVAAERPARAAVASVRALPRRIEWGPLSVHLLLIAAVLVVGFPLYYAFVISTQSIQEVTAATPTVWPSGHLWANYAEAWTRAKMARLLLNSAVVALAIASGKIAISILSAFAIVYFHFRLKQVVFWMIFITLMLPVPVRIIST
ncbi:MAG: hypothetical protein HY575_09365, partial [candidate division NC10 bacterium]|nr:hypothetical protein [candidate division NC10 bacterium]